MFHKKNRIIHDEKFRYLFDDKEKTASICGTYYRYPHAYQSIIPISIKKDSEEYIITKIASNAFDRYCNCVSIKFSYNSRIKEIEKLGFFNSSIFNIIIHPQLIKIGEYAFTHSSLEKIDFPINYQLQIIEKKAFESTFIKSIFIPPQVTEIKENTFRFCGELTKVNFPINSKLEAFGNGAFSWCSSLEKICIPPKVIIIGISCFSSCQELRKIEIPWNSKLQIIKSYAFACTQIETISIPSDIVKMEDGWCGSTSKLNKIKILPRSDKNIIYYENKLILGKSNLKSDTYDILHFANRNIKTVTIPSFVKTISSYSFENCSLLEHVEIPTNSELQIIGKNAFCGTSLKRIFIPNHVTKVSKHAFNNCEKLQKTEISENSELEEIGYMAFYNTGIKCICLPKTLKNIERWSLTNCQNLLIVEISEDFRSNILELLDSMRRLIIMIPFN